MTVRTCWCSIALVLTCGFYASAHAQSEPQTTSSLRPASQSQAASSTASPDLEITANVTARELRFEVVPNPTVEFTGKPERVTVWDAERDNLPRPVQPGVTYRNIGIRLKITSIFADIDRIVAEALGEVPVTDDAPPGNNVTETKEGATLAPAETPAPATTAPQKGGKPW